MNAYSKLRIFNKKSRSIEFSDLLITHITSPDETEKTHERNAPETSPSQNSKRTVHEGIHTIKEHDDRDQDHDDGVEGVQARNTNYRSVGAMQFSNKSSSLSSATSSKLERQSSATTTTATISSSSSSSTRKRGIQSALKRAFSMRRSSTSSVSHEKYCRIHGQCGAILLNKDDDDDYDDDGVIDNEDDNNTMGSSTENKKCGSKGKILKACKRLLGFHSTKY